MVEYLIVAQVTLDRFQAQAIIFLFFFLFISPKIIINVFIAIKEINLFYCWAIKLRVRQNHLVFRGVHKAPEACQEEFLHMQHQDSLHSKQMRVHPLLCPSQRQRCLLFEHTFQTISLAHILCSLCNCEEVQNTILNCSSKSTTRICSSYHFRSSLCQMAQHQCKYHLHYCFLN